MATNNHQMDLPDLPVLPSSQDNNIIQASEFTRKKLKILIHLITGELKLKGTKTPHIFLPFRSKVNDVYLENLLQKLFPKGELISQDETVLNQIIKSTDEFTLICCLKYFWSRLPNNEVVGWDVYLEYKRREKEANYPKDAFFTIMPKCLSPAHASIFYDFMDLLMSVASNSQYNYLSGRKITKMSSIWAFNSNKLSKSVFYDATKENNFMDGLEIWKSTSDALFHLLLSFLRASLPDNDADALKLPKTLQSLIVTNSYPPQLDDSIKSMITIPCVSIKSTKVSSNPYELLSKARHTLSFDKKNQFGSIENYTILKNLFQKDSTADIVNTLTDESKRILTRLAAKPIDSKYDLKPGWSFNQSNIDDDIPLYSQITIIDVTLRDYYIWTWLSSLGSDQTSRMKKLFGRSIVVEAGLKGFQKWLIITEQTMTRSEYLEIFKQPEDVKSKEPLGLGSGVDKRKKALPEIKSLIPPPLPSKDTHSKVTKQKKDLLPDISFGNDDFKAEVQRSPHFSLNGNDDEISSEYRSYLKGLDELDVDNISESLAESTFSKPVSSLKSLPKRRPPPHRDLTNEQSILKNDFNSANPNVSTDSKSKRRSNIGKSISQTIFSSLENETHSEINNGLKDLQIAKTRASNFKGANGNSKYPDESEQKNLDTFDEGLNGRMENSHGGTTKNAGGQVKQKYSSMIPRSPKKVPMIPPLDFGTENLMDSLPTSLNQHSPIEHTSNMIQSHDMLDLPLEGSRYKKLSPERSSKSRSVSPSKRKSKSPKAGATFDTDNVNSVVPVEDIIQRTMDQIRETMNSIEIQKDNSRIKDGPKVQVSNQKRPHLKIHPNESASISDPLNTTSEQQLMKNKQKQQEKQHLNENSEYHHHHHHHHHQEERLNNLSHEQIELREGNSMPPVSYEQYVHPIPEKQNNDFSHGKQIQGKKIELSALPVEGSKEQRHISESFKSGGLLDQQEFATPNRTSLPLPNNKRITTKSDNIDQQSKQNQKETSNDNLPTSYRQPGQPVQQQPIGYAQQSNYHMDYLPQMIHGTQPVESSQIPTHPPGWPQQRNYPPANGYHSPHPNAQPGIYSPMNYPQANFPPVKYPPVKYPPVNYPQANYPPANYPPANYPPANYPPANYPPANYPPAKYSIGSYPSYPPQAYHVPHSYPPPVHHGTNPNIGLSKGSGLAMIPKADRFNKNETKNKANIRHALNEGFGI